MLLHSDKSIATQAVNEDNSNFYRQPMGRLSMFSVHLHVRQLSHIASSIFFFQIRENCSRIGHNFYSKSCYNIVRAISATTAQLRKVRHAFDQVGRTL